MSRRRLTDVSRAQPHQAVETGGETVQVFARQADDEVGMQVDVGVLAQPAQVFLGLGDVLLAADERLHLGIEGLHADFELQAARREAQDGLFVCRADGRESVLKWRNSFVQAFEKKSRMLRQASMFRLKVRSTNLNSRNPRS
jgi:hypothetical protein